MSEIETQLSPRWFEVYVVGEDAADAQNWNPYDTLEEAKEFAESGWDGNTTLKVFKARAHVDFGTLEEV